MSSLPPLPLPADPADWPAVRRGLTELIGREEYGFLPPLETTLRLCDCRPAERADALCKTVEVEATRQGRQFSFAFNLFVPTAAGRPVPAFLVIVLSRRGVAEMDPRDRGGDFYPIARLIGRGYACAAFTTREVAPDYEEGFTTGLWRLFPEYAGEDRPGDMGGALSAWSWAASRIMDWFLQDPDIDEKRVALVGHSRGGKAALWTAARDPRFSMVFSSCAGCSGDALSRDKEGERIDHITRVFPFWFCRNYRQYARREDALPFDQHTLLAAIAPRRVYLTARTEDGWADPSAQFAGALAASPAWEQFGLTGLETGRMPAPGEALQRGHVGFHLLPGAHTMDGEDWIRYLRYAEAFL